MPASSSRAPCVCRCCSSRSSAIAPDASIVVTRLKSRMMNFAPGASGSTSRASRLAVPKKTAPSSWTSAISPAAFAQHPRLRRRVQAPRRAGLAGGDRSHQRAIHRDDEQHHRQQDAGGDGDDEAEEDGDDADQHDHDEAPQRLVVGEAGTELPPHHPAPAVEQPQPDEQHQSRGHRDGDVCERPPAEHQDRQQRRDRDGAGQRGAAAAAVIGERRRGREDDRDATERRREPGSRGPGRRGSGSAGAAWRKGCRSPPPTAARPSSRSAPSPRRWRRAGEVVAQQGGEAVAERAAPARRDAARRPPPSRACLPAPRRAATAARARRRRCRTADPPAPPARAARRATPATPPPRSPAPVRCCPGSRARGHRG